MACDIQDPFGRAIRYLRVSVTDRCNLRCVYCMPEHGVPYEAPDKLLSVDEIARIVLLLSRHGLAKVRVTGGEPLVRSAEVIDLIGRISAIPQIADIGLTTNGILLERHARALRAAGLKRINISLDTLRRERYARIARMDRFDETIAGLHAAEAAGFSPIKLNMVLMKGINDDEIADFARLTLDHAYHVRFLEYMPIGQVTPHEWRARYLSNDCVLDRLNGEFAMEPIEVDASSTSRRLRIEGASGYVEVISPISHRFCAGCNRLRLTANGALAPCLSDNYEYDLRGPLRAGASDDELLGHIRAAVSHKPVQSDFEGRVNRGGSLRIMAQIGG
ncbi:MAG: GTP 3',8-cyclase MoaA [Capsulimonadaceae bacterium]|nr:GTP 3',8-cyclase MoaA [Capsulimonadaceae bacterium]